jgi:hypothetical protein
MKTKEPLDPWAQRFSMSRGVDISALVKCGYPPDKQPGAIKLVMEQMESMVPRYSEERSG